MDFGGQEMDESGISIGFDFTDIDSQLLDINDLFPDELLQTAPQETEPINFYEITSRPAPVQSPSFKSESVSSRTQLKQQLMKDQLLKERERIKPKELPKSPAPRPVKVPVNIQNVVPQHVLQVKTGLQNPTKYHILEKQKNQVIQFLSSSQKEKANFGERREAYSAPLLQRSPAAVGRPAASFTIPPTSPGMLSVASNDNSDAEVIDSILSYEENSDAPRSLYGSNASLESSSRFKSEPESYEDVGKERVKKETHNMIERRRRYNINDRIMELKDLLPNRNEPHYDVVRDSRSNKGTILKSSVDYIKFLKEDVHKMKQIEVDNRNLQLENRKLLLRIQQLEIKAQQKGIDLEEKTWKPASAEEILAGAVKSIRGPSLAHMPDVVTDAACRYDETMDDVPSPDPMLTAAAALPLPSRPHRPSPLSPMEIQ